MSEKYKTFESDAPYFITMTIVRWLPLLSLPEFSSIVLESLRHCTIHKGLTIFGYCLMPSHLHLIVQSEKVTLGSVIRDFKKYTAVKIAQVCKCDPDKSGYLEVFRQEAASIERNTNLKIWQDGYHPEIIFSNDFFFQKLNYIHQNPVVAGFVSNPEDYYFSSARNYAGLDAPLEIVLESQRLITY